MIRRKGEIGGGWGKGNALDLWTDTTEHLRKRGITKTVDVSPSVLLPLLGAAMDEDREVVKELWARLRAAAIEPNISLLGRCHHSTANSPKPSAPSNPATLGEGEPAPTPRGSRRRVRSVADRPH